MKSQPVKQFLHSVLSPFADEELKMYNSENALNQSGGDYVSLTGS